MKNVELVRDKKINIGGDILVIEDNENCCFLIKEYLDLIYDIRCINVSNDFSPKKIIQEPSKVKLIIINFNIIKAYNLELIKEIQKRIPIITITSDNSPEGMERIQNYGFDEVILKPILATEFIAIVSKFL